MALWNFGRLARIRHLLVSASTRTTSWWTHVEQGPPDAIFGLVEAFKKDPRPEKISLAIGAYRDANNKPFVLPTVRKASFMGIWHHMKLNLPLNECRVAIARYSYFTHHILSHFFSCACPIVCRACFTPQAKFWPGSKTIYLPNPSWPNHKPVFSSSGLEVKSYSYYDSSTCGLDSTGLYHDLQSLPEKSVVLFHACAHNPTGVDPKMAEWKEISRICKGFATGDLDNDAAGVRQLAADGHNLLLCQSFSKNLGLYGERVGAMTVLCSDPEEAKRVESQLKIIIRPLYSNPPINGARIATHILNTPALYNEWFNAGLEPHHGADWDVLLLGDDPRAGGQTPVRVWNIHDQGRPDLHGCSHTGQRGSCSQSHAPGHQVTPAKMDQFIAVPRAIYFSD
ncbi:Aspartate aminotransferase, mitochondrial [Geodia barretti]|uniref:Aspartate aminotransferase n=2 Tax=Geodia barretti TaxID=519541 RepID=A0AA35R8I9_GEOBA|nr:Aspartate aminotransferase, mitochondrial [Geodia barretti]